MLGCLGAWVLGCLGAWVLGCLGAWVLGCLGIWVLAKGEIEGDGNSLYVPLSQSRGGGMSEASSQKGEGQFGGLAFESANLSPLPYHPFFELDKSESGPDTYCAYHFDIIGHNLDLPCNRTTL